MVISHHENNYGGALGSPKLSKNSSCRTGPLLGQRRAIKLARGLRAALDKTLSKKEQGAMSRRCIFEHARRAGVLLLVIAITLPALPGASAAEKFQRLNGAQIQARFSGVEFSDDVHWRDYYMRGGAYKGRSMGRQRTGKWWVEKNQLCIDSGKDSGGCYEVWLSGRKVEFRREGLGGPILEGTLQKPTAGH